MKKFLSIVAILSLVFSPATPALAADASWTGATANADWSDAGNWSAVTPGTGNIATFDAAAGVGGATINLTGETVNTIQFNNAATAAYTIGNGGAGVDTLTLNNGGAINMTVANDANQIVNANLVLGTDGTAQTVTLTNNSVGNTMTVSGAITGSTGAGIKTLAIAGTDNITLNTGVIGDGAGGGTVALTKSGAGTLTLAGTNTYSGGTTIKAGTVSGTTNAAAFGTGTITIGDSAAALDATLSGGLAGTFANTISIASGNTGTATITSTAASIFSGGVTLNSHGLTLTTGAATLTLSGAIASTGTANNIILNATAGNAITLSNASINNVGTITNSGAGGATNVISGNILTNVTGVVQNAANSALTLSGTNTFTTGVTLTQGTLNLGSNSALGTGTLTITTGTLDALTADRTITNAMTVNGSFAFTGTNNLSQGTGAITLGASSTVTVTANTLTLAGNVGETGGARAITKAGNGTLVLSGTNTYTGITTINAGTVSIAADSGLGTAPAAVTATAITFGGGTLDISDTFTLNSNRGITLTGAGTIDVDAGKTLTYNGIMTGAGAFTKTSTGTLILGGVNTNSGAVNINGGTLQISAATGLGDGSGTNTIAMNTGTLRSSSGTYSLDADQDITLNGAGTIQVDDGTLTLVAGQSITNGANLLTVTGSGNTVIAGVIGNGAGGLTKSGTGTLTLSGANDYTGVTTYDGGTVSVSSLANGGSASNIGKATNAASKQVFDGGILSYTGNSVTIDRGFTVNASQTGEIDVTTSGQTLTLGTTGISFSGAAPTVTGITFGGAGNTTVTAQITGAGMVTKAGAGTLTLSQTTNDYTGATTVSEGTLKLGADAVITDTSALTVASGATFNLNNFDETVGSLAGAGTVDNSGAGAKTLTAGGDDTSTTFSGTLTDSGAGSLAFSKAGTGATTLSGANTHSGTTTLGSTGTLNINNASALGTGTFAITAAGTIDNTSGSAITLSTNNVQTWGANFAFTGTNDLNLGTGGVTLSATRTVTTTAGNLTVGGIIGDGVGTFGVTKAGAGTLTLGGVHHTYDGGTTLNAGTIAFGGNATLDGDFTHAGTSTVLDLGSSTITLDSGAAGDYSQATATTPIIKTTVSASGAGKVDASTASSGTFTTLAASELQITPSGYIPSGTSWVILNGKDASNGGIVVPGTLTYTSSVLTFSATTDADGDDLTLTATRSGSYNSVATNGNASAAGAELEAIGKAGATGDMLTVLNEIDQGTTSQVEKAMDTVISDPSGGAPQTSFAAGDMFMGSVSNRLGFARSGLASTNGVSTGNSFQGMGFWLQGLGSHIRQDSRKGIAGYKANILGTSLGFDQLIDKHYRLGLAGGYAWSDMKSKTAGSPKTSADSWQVSLYGSYDSLDLCKKDQNNERGSKGGVRNPGENSWYTDGLIAFTQNNYDSRRDIILPTETRVAKADHHGQEYSTKVEAGYTFVFEETKSLEVTPFASLGYNFLYMNDYKEKGADALNLNVDGESLHQLEQALGTKFAYPIVSKKAGTFIPSVKAAWLFDYIADRFETTASFAGGGSSFTTKSAKPARNACVVGGEIAYLNRGNMTLTANYDLELKDEYQSHTYYGTARFDF